MKRTLYEPEHELFRESVRQFVAKEVLPRREEHRANRLIDRETWKKAGDLGFLGLGVPAEYGGSDVDDFRFNAILAEELAPIGLAYSSSFGLQVDIVAPYLIRLTTPEQKERWLPGFCTGDIITAIGMTEPEAGSDLAGLKTTAVKNGDGWVVNGSKTFITNGGSADLVVTAAKTGGGPKGKGITLFGLESTLDGFSHGRVLEKVGQHEADTAELFFEDVRVPAELQIGELDGGFKHMMAHLAQERMGSAVANIAHARAAFEVTLEYAKSRNAFGRPIGTFQNSRFLLADLQTRIDVTQAFVDQCIVAHVAGELDAVDAAKAKWWSSDMQNALVNACVQLHGGYGYMEEYEIAHFWMDARITPIWAGSNEIMKEIIGRNLGLGDPR
ncbi:MAG: acyl-CoA dehydrogenase family protein [Solirubrobacteraceae bacterium]|nr:acyl-CoA dehydrogenase family protein [Solirubrobacteraceae bacterium]